MKAIKGEVVVSSFILWIGMIIIGLFMLYAVSSYVLIPTVDVLNKIETRSAAGLMASAINVMSQADAGQAGMDFGNSYDIESSGRKLYFTVAGEKKEMQLYSDIQTGSVSSRSICIRKEPGKDVSIAGGTC